MNRIPVLFLLSTYIDMKELNKSPRFSSYRFYYLTAIRYIEKNNASLSIRKMTNALNKKAHKIGPSHLIVHLGLVFERYPFEYLISVLDMKVHHKSLKVGLDRGLEYAIQRIQLIHSSTFDKENLINRLIANRLLFESDEETLHLASLLF